MGRPLRIEYPGAWYHVMNRGAGRRKIFKDKRDTQLFLELLGEISQTFSAQIHAFSLMPNHYHLLIHTPKAGLGRALRHLNGVYTLRYNRRHKTDGALFRGRYKARLVEDEEYLLALVRYIHLNPVKAGLVKTPSVHPWTSHRYYLKGNKNVKWLVTDEIMGRFGRSKKKFNAYVSEKIPERQRKDLMEWTPILGSRGFQEWVYANWVKEKLQDKEISKKEKMPQWKGLKTILEKVAFAHDISVTQLRRRQDRRRNDARSMAIYLARKLTGIPQKDLARWMNATNEYAIAKVQQRFSSRLLADSKLRRMTKTIERTF
jgi:putative transposase